MFEFRRVSRLTFDLQLDVVLLDAQGVGGDAGVAAAVERLGRVDLQRAVLVDHVGVQVLDGRGAALEPAGERGLW